MAEPLRTTTFTLSRADALAFEQASARSSPLGVMALLLWLGACASLAFIIPADYAGVRLGWGFSILASVLIAIGYTLVLVGIAIRQWLAAGRRIRRPMEVTLTEWPDRLDVVATGMPRELRLADIRESILGRAHLFLVSDDGVLILPRAAFSEEGAIETLAARIAGAPATPPSPSTTLRG